MLGKQNAVQRAFVNQYNVKSAPRRKSILAAEWKIFLKNGNAKIYEPNFFSKSVNQ